MRVDMAPFNNVRVPAPSLMPSTARHPSTRSMVEASRPALARDLIEWALPPDQLGEGAKYYQYDPKGQAPALRPDIPRD